MIEINGEMLVIGGDPYNKPIKTERCMFQGDRLECVQQEPTLYNYRIYPELLAVSDDFCA